jgi:hypothetical protein
MLYNSGMHPLALLDHPLGKLGEAWVRGVPPDDMPAPTREILIELWGPVLGAHIHESSESETERKLAVILGWLMRDDPAAADKAMFVSELKRMVDDHPSRQRKTGSRTWPRSQRKQTEWLRLLDLPHMQHGGKRANQTGRPRKASAL